MARCYQDRWRRSAKTFATLPWSWKARNWLGCGALHLYGTHLAEIRSIAVWPNYQGAGAGRLLVDALLEEAEQHHVDCVCLFTRIPAFFAHLGFA